ncbi:MAG: NAD+ synthase, partial [Candidatus Eremiobacteraeota bacterium]|nr:NAD+ synthase [Candidatus Eremiobacteraeota bacterium]
MLPVLDPPKRDPYAAPKIDPAVAAGWLVAFLRDECLGRRGIENAVVGLSGGVDSAVTAYLCVHALGQRNVHLVRMPYRTSSAASLDDAELVIDALGAVGHTVDISAAVDGYLQYEPDA